MALIAVVVGGMLFLAGQVLVQSCACTTAPDAAETPVALADRSA